MEDISTTHYQKYKQTHQQSHKKWVEENRERVNSYQRNYYKNKNDKIKKDLQKLKELERLFNQNQNL